MSEVDMRVTIAGLTLQNPVMPASGTFAEEMAALLDLNRLGAFVTKSVTPTARSGNKGPRIAETTAGIINAVGIQSKGVDYVIQHSVPFYRKFSPPLVISISADTADEFAHLAEKASVSGVSALEVNISCPNVEDDGKSYAMVPDQTFRVMEKVRAVTELPLFAKLTPNTNDIVAVAKAAVSAGADALVIANTILAMAIDIETRKPKVGNVMGGLSGPAIKPVIVRMVYQVANQVDAPIIASGGIRTAEDAVEYMIAGATAVQVGTHNFVQPTCMLDVIDGLSAYAERHGISAIRDIIGTVLTDKPVLKQQKPP